MLCVLIGPVRWAGLGAEVAVLAVLVAVVGFQAAPAGLLAVGSSVLSLNGFAEHRFGQLGWEPGVDGPVTVVLLCAWAIAWAAREDLPAGGRSQCRFLSVDDIIYFDEGDR